MTTYDALRRQYAANATSFAALAVKAARTGRANGQSAEHWQALAASYRALSVADDATVAAHLRAARQSASARLSAFNRDGRAVTIVVPE